MNIERHDRTIVKAFVAHLRKHGQCDLEVDSWPEDARPGTSEIDALAGHLAIEHTSIDTLANQRRDSARFGETVSPLEASLSPLLQFRLRVCFPYDAIAVGQNWAAIRIAVAVWVVLDAGSLADGVHFITIPGTTFKSRIDKDSDGEPALVFYRAAAHDPSLAARVREQILRKASKLARYSSERRTTVLLVESIDGSLMNQHKMLQAIGQELPQLPPAIDQLWYVDAPRGLAAEFFDFTPFLRDNLRGRADSNKAGS